MLRRALTGLFWLLAASCALAQGVPGLTPFLASSLIPLQWNANDKASGVTLSNGNLTMTVSGGYFSARSLDGKTSGKWAFEATAVSGSGAGWALGLATSAYTLFNFPGSGTGSIGYTENGSYWADGSSTSGKATIAAGDVIGCTIDFAGGASAITFYKNNVSQGSVAIPAGLAGQAVFVMGANINTSWTLNTTPTYAYPGFTYWGN